MNYFDELCNAMDLLARDPRTIFMGQAVEYAGTAMSKTFKSVPREKLFEMPVAEDFQMGMAIGCALNGEIPVCCYPRINFLLCAINQLVLHLDKIPTYSRGQYAPIVIIRTSIGNSYPLNPGAQHLGDYTNAIAGMLSDVRVSRLSLPEDIVPAYQKALNADRPTLLVEQMGKY